MTEPRTRDDYGRRQIEAARLTLVDLGQVLGTFFRDSIVVVGGWVPDLLLPGATEPHVGSIDVDLALDADKLREGRYAEVVKSLLSTGRYERVAEHFKLRACRPRGRWAARRGRCRLSQGSRAATETSRTQDPEGLSPARRRRLRGGILPPRTGEDRGTLDLGR
ncbi:MAG: hypothetical protein K8E66_11130, partial [Phycisphaerales bacterium]|nr:hypothetical protein [Phycisphaerales bacterium]